MEDNNVIDLKREEAPKAIEISKAILTELRKSNALLGASEKKLGQIRADYLAQENKLLRTIEAARQTFSQNLKNALLAANIEQEDQERSWDIDLEKGTIVQR